MAQLSSTQVGGLSTGGVKGLTTAQVVALTTAQVPGLGTALMGALPLLTIEPIAFSTMLLNPPALLPGVVLALRSAPPRCR